MRDFTDLMKMDLEPKGVMVQASTLGALEALMQFLRKECDPPIPVFAVGIGAVYKKDVMRASIMNEKVSRCFLWLHDFEHVNDIYGYEVSCFCCSQSVWCIGSMILSMSKEEVAVGVIFVFSQSVLCSMIFCLV